MNSAPHDKSELTPDEPTHVPPVPRRVAVRRLRRAQVLYAAGLAAFAVLALFAYFNAYFGWDLRAALVVQSLDAPWFAALMRWASAFGNSWTPHLLTIATALVFAVCGRRSEAAGVTLSAGGGALIANLLKVLVGRPRPAAELVGFAYDGSGMSFPSGHVTFYVCYFGFLFFAAYALLPRGALVRRAALVATVLPVLVVGFSRVYLHAHWPSDTLGAYLVSGLWLAFSLAAYRRWKQRATFHHRTAPVAE
ncbi:MAG: phosphatase PAP2 family protein [Acidobacteria bacterium]|nr:phosphatase PAP2 family protein [Acidobacteriota bacterium]